VRVDIVRKLSSVICESAQRTHQPSPWIPAIVVISEVYHDTPRSPYSLIPAWIGLQFEA
jgi:hypothetical protein